MRSATLLNLSSTENTGTTSVLCLPLKSLCILSAILTSEGVSGRYLTGRGRHYLYSSVATAIGVTLYSPFIFNIQRQKNARHISVNWKALVFYTRIRPWFPGPHYCLILPLLEVAFPPSASCVWYDLVLQPLSKPSKEPVITPFMVMDMFSSHMVTSIAASTVDHTLNTVESSSFPSCSAAFV